MPLSIAVEVRGHDSGARPSMCVATSSTRWCGMLSWHESSLRTCSCTLIPDVEAKLAFRGRTRDTTTTELATKEPRYRRLWAVRLGQHMATLPPLDDVFRALRRSLRDADLVDR